MLAQKDLRKHRPRFTSFLRQQKDNGSVLDVVLFSQKNTCYPVADFVFALEGCGVAAI